MAPAGKAYDYRDISVFEKLRFQLNIFPSTLKRKAGVFRFLPCFKSNLIRITSFSQRISVDSGPDRRNKAAFLNSSDVVYTLELIVDC